MAKENLANNYFDFDGFLAAIVRLTILSVDILGGQGTEQIQVSQQVNGVKNDRLNKEKDRVKNQEFRRKQIEAETFNEMRIEFNNRLLTIKQSKSKTPLRSREPSAYSKSGGRSTS
jgi:2',3'-cyclic-nucleotide 2'-phosphodiesterase (5'-nucleotidase family)